MPPSAALVMRFTVPPRKIQIPACAPIVFHDLHSCVFPCANLLLGIRLIESAVCLTVRDCEQEDQEAHRVSSPTVVVIGNFDGVHRGHAELIRMARASEPGARVVAITFWPHPMSVIRPDQTPLLLTTL